MPLRMPSGFSRVAGSDVIPASYGDWEKRLPHLCAFLCDCKWEDGSSKRPGKLSVWTGDGLWKGCLSLPAPAVVAFLAAQEPSALLMLMEKQLRDDSVDWRRSVAPAKNSTRRAGREG
jgi:hypothetical protein